MQPKYAGVLGYLGWNMAYNISVTESDYRERWRWVNNGTGLLLNALESNPDDSHLYRELGWIYFHKMGGGAR